jgi:hypothetical protein
VPFVLLDVVFYLDLGLFFFSSLVPWPGAFYLFIYLFKEGWGAPVFSFQAIHLQPPSI